MATYQDFSLIKKEAEFVKKRNDVDKLSMAFIFMVLEKLYPDIEPFENITDSGRDLSIDAYYIDKNTKTINIFQFKYTEKFDIARNKNALKEEEMNDFIVKLKSIWDRDEEFVKKANHKLKDAIKEIWSAFEDGYTKTNIYFVSNYKETVNGGNIKEIQKKLKNEFRGELKILSLDDLIKVFIKEEFSPIDIKLQLKGKNYFEESTGNVRALISEVNALNFLKSILDENDNLIEDVFNENVRVYLRSNTKINKQIYNSIESKSNYKFFYYNNGITAICDNFEHNFSDSPVVNMDNFQIVNGGQTMHAIYEAYKNGLQDNVGNIYLLLRVYEVKKNREIGQEIARFTNTQNPVKNRDIMSNDIIQVKLQKELKKEGFFYERKKYESRDQKIGNDKKIDAEKLGQSILAFYVDKPGSAKNKKQEIFGDFYNDVFDEEKIDSNFALLPYLLYKKINDDVRKFSAELKRLEKAGKTKGMKTKIEKNGFLNYAHYYLLFTLKTLANKNSILLEKANITKILKKYNKAKNILRKIVNEEKKNPKFSMPYLFKTDDLVKKIKDEVNK